MILFNHTQYYKCRQHVSLDRFMQMDTFQPRKVYRLFASIAIIGSSVPSLILSVCTFILAVQQNSCLLRLEIRGKG